MTDAERDLEDKQMESKWTVEGVFALTLLGCWAAFPWIVLIIALLVDRLVR